MVLQFTVFLYCSKGEEKRLLFHICGGERYCFHFIEVVINFVLLMNARQEDGVDLAATIKAASFYRRSQYLDYVSDFVPPSPAEFRKIYDDFR